MLVRTALQRLIATVAALGMLLGLALVALLPSTAQAAPPTCQPSYPASVATTTSVNLVRNVGEYGDSNTVTVRVRSDAGVPDGRVNLRISDGGGFYALDLNGGVARRSLPDDLDARTTYTVTATYQGEGCYAGSSDSASYTVQRAGVRIVGFNARTIHRGDRPFVSGRVVTTSGATATGRVTVRLYFRGLRDVESDRLDDGRFAIRFDRVYQVGTWTARASLPDSDNFSGDTASDQFRVLR
jgi:hypothetical protein